MSPPIKLFCIGFAAPALSFALGSTVWSFVFLFLAILGYPIMVVVTLALIYPLHLFFGRSTGHPHLSATPRSLGGSRWRICGLRRSFRRRYFGRQAFSVRLALEYSSLGVLAGICAWLLYNFGPLKLSKMNSRRSNEPAL
jgi:hypothetical protein